MKIRKNRPLLFSRYTGRGSNASLFFVLVLLLSACLADEGRLRFERGEELRGSGRYDEAVKEFRWVATHYGKTDLAPLALFNAGELNYLYLSEFDSALNTFRELLANYPWSDKCRPSQKYIAEIYMDKRHDYKQAIVEYQKAISYYGGAEESEKFQYEIAKAYFNLGNFAQQRIELHLLLSRFPETKLTGEAYYQIANSFYVEGKLDEAVQAYRKIIDVFPNTPLALESTFQLAACLEESEELKEAIELLEEIEGIYSNAKVIRQRIDRMKTRLKERRR